MHRLLYSPILALGFALGAVGCSNALHDARSEELLALVHESEIEHFVATFALEAPARAVQWAERQVDAPSWDTVIAQLGRDLSWDDSRTRLLMSLYEGRRGSFVRSGLLTSDGVDTLEMLRTAMTIHGMDNRGWHLSEMSSRMEVLGRDDRVQELHDALRLKQEDEAVLRAWLTELVGADGSAPSHPDISQRLLRQDEDNPLPGFAETGRQLATKFSESAIAAPELEILLAAGWLQMAEEMRLGNFYFIPRDVRQEREWNIHDPSQRETILEEHLRNAFAEARHEGFVEVMSRLEPPSEQYGRLKGSLARYLGYVEQGGWRELDVSPNALRPGVTSDSVPSLRQRLHSEGFLDADELEGEEYDATLRQAVLQYQHTHQLTENGQVDRMTLTSLNVPAERRAAQVAVSLQRWRESTIGADFERRHIRVSLPDFHAEIWEGPERLMRFRTVIGSTRRIRNPRTGRMELATATPTFYRSLRYVVFNPTWNIPPGIRARDYDPLIEENPNYLEENGYQLIVGADGNEFIRQPPGPSNPLGRVKFLFPNEHHVYMHDTPSRHLFSHPIRAYSSGCIRVQGAMDFAELLLRLDRGWNDRRIESYIEEQFDDPDNERWTTLITPIPVHIEYYVVRGDDDGETHFLADIYRWDVERVDDMERMLFPSSAGETVSEAIPDAPAHLISGP